jgi:hypothetical protein
MHQGDALQVLRALPAHSADSLVTDPPAGIGYLGESWDFDRGGRAAWIAWLAAILQETLRVVTPGAHAVVWALPRTSHWTATAMEDAGWEIRDVAVHLQAQGYPKSRALLKPSAEHWILARTAGPLRSLNTGGCALDGGRYPANATFEHAPECGARCAAGCPVGQLDAQSGTRPSSAMRAGTPRRNTQSFSGGF